MGNKIVAEPSPPPSPPPSDDAKELPHEEIQRIKTNLDLNKVCYCGTELSQFHGQQHIDWICSSCYKWIPNDYIPSYMCPLANHSRYYCNYARIYGNPVNVCRDCYDGTNDPIETDPTQNDNTKSLLFQKLNHTLDLIS